MVDLTEIAIAGFAHLAAAREVGAVLWVRLHQNHEHLHMALTNPAIEAPGRILCAQLAG